MGVILISLSPIGVLAGLGILRFRRQPSITPMSWWYAHMTAILGAGIAFHTAFFVFGAARYLTLPGLAQVVPWVAPTLMMPPLILRVPREMLGWTLARPAAESW